MKILAGDCIETMKALEANSVDAIVTDPPYGISFMGKAWDGKDIEALAKRKQRKETQRPDGVKRHDGVAFAAGTYDLSPKGLNSFQVWTKEWAEQALRVLKPGGHLLSFSSARTYHRMASGIEDAGFEIRDQIMWLYGSGFPKNLNVSKAIDAAAGIERPPLTETVPADLLDEEREIEMVDERMNEPSGIVDAGQGERTPVTRRLTGPGSPDAERWDGWGTALKPAHEPIVLARKPLSGTVVENVLKHGVGAINVDGCRVGDAGGVRKVKDDLFGDDARNPAGGQLGIGYGCNGKLEDIGMGRWPANVVHDGSPEVVSQFPDVETARVEKPSDCATDGMTSFAAMRGSRPARGYDGSGPAARFFYCAKTSNLDRDQGMAENRNNHPTVKPTALMRYLVRLITPPGGVVLDPFMGSGSTGKACILEGAEFIGIEREAEYLAIAAARIEHAHTLRDEELKADEPPPLLSLMVGEKAA